MTEEAEFRTARFAPLPLDSQGNPTQGKAIPVDFNPEKLQYDVSNTLQNKGKGSKKKQYVSESTAKLTMELVFDTTLDGQDVRNRTQELARLMDPARGADKKAPPVVEFQWGSYKFRGMVESFKETIDFFAPNGIPLRSTVNLVMSRQDEVFAPQDTSGSFDSQQANAANRPAVEVPTAPAEGGGGGPGQNAAQAAAQSGDPRGARAIGAANGQESLRFASGDSLVVAPPAQLGGAVAFASAGAGAGIGVGGGGGLSAGAGAGLSAGAGAGVSLGASAGAGLTAGASASVPAGARASAGVSASAGAFTALSTVRRDTRVSLNLDPERLLAVNATANLSTDVGASFGIGGQASLQGSASLRAEVGANASLRARLQFDSTP
ncbi:MAG: hypothetical protein KatS3mg050_1032 [Litorilinea sp.]|nr:MAG: hypothetical protein KatS3mg050_1032 [Litorilinea sp.]